MNKATTIQSLRRALADEAPRLEAFVLQVADPSALSGIVVVQNGMLQTTLSRSRFDNITIPLGTTGHETVGAVVAALRRKPGHVVTPSEVMIEAHPSLDLTIESGGDLLAPTGVRFVHHRFSERELWDLWARAAQRHNIRFGPDDVPEAELGLVLKLAHAEGLRDLAMSAARRRGLGSEAPDLLAVVDSIEASYRDDRNRQAHAIAAPPANQNAADEVVNGGMYRERTRFGIKTPIGRSVPADPPIVEPPGPGEVTDDRITLRWQRPRDNQGVASVEVWRDIVPAVRPAESPDLTTSIRVARGGMGELWWSWWPLLGGGGSATRAFGFVDGEQNPLEPDTDYYYVVAFIDANNERVESKPIRVRTLKPRARFRAKPPPNPALDNPIEPTFGPTGTVITIHGTRFHEGMWVRIGDLQVLPTILDPTLLTVVAPAHNPALKDRFVNVILVSRDGQLDVARNAWRWTS